MSLDWAWSGLMRHLIQRLGLLALVALVSFYGCGGPSSDISGEKSGQATTPKAEIADLRRAPENVTADASRSVLSRSEQPSTEEPALLTAGRDDPEPGTRLQSLETWEREPKKTLDPITYALVDPDEKVRARAQELLEEELARR
jgi:hypothetical protein